MSTIRITSGLYKNTKLAVPPSAHPMGERERTAIFNSLGDQIQGAKVLDAFAGTGALGLEALSRGATSADFLEKSPVALKDNLRKLSLTNQTKIIKNPIKNYNIIFADPPYDNPQLPLITELTTHLAPSGTLILSLPTSHPTPAFKNLTLASEKSYARAHILTYRAAQKSPL